MEAKKNYEEYLEILKEWEGKMLVEGKEKLVRKSVRESLQKHLTKPAKIISAARRKLMQIKLRKTKEAVKKIKKLEREVKKLKKKTKKVIQTV